MLRFLLQSLRKIQIQANLGLHLYFKKWLCSLHTVAMDKRYSSLRSTAIHHKSPHKATCAQGPCARLHAKQVECMTQVSTDSEPRKNRASLHAISAKLHDNQKSALLKLTRKATSILPRTRFLTTIIERNDTCDCPNKPVHLRNLVPSLNKF